MNCVHITIQEIGGIQRTILFDGSINQGMIMDGYNFCPKCGCGIDHIEDQIMDDQIKEILKKVVKKAEKNGFNYWNWAENLTHVHFDYKDRFAGVVGTKIYYALIFSHFFAKTFWGEQIVCEECGDEIHFCRGEASCGCFGVKGTANWRYHLQQLVLEIEPLKYLEKFLK